jgi:hypothetical protein
MIDRFWAVVSHSTIAFSLCTDLLHAWRKSRDPDAPERCESLLAEMYELSDTGNLPNCKPDTFAVTVR